jgi:hypothetical protein
MKTKMNTVTEVVASLGVGNGETQEIRYAHGQFFIKYPEAPLTRITKKAALRKYFKFVANSFGGGDLTTYSPETLLAAV